MKKEELIKILKNAFIAEEKAMPIYSRHLDSALFWVGIDQGKAREIAGILKQLASDSEGHKETLKRLIEKLEKEDRDVV